MESRDNYMIRHGRGFCGNIQKNKRTVYSWEVLFLRRIIFCMVCLFLIFLIFIPDQNVVAAQNYQRQKTQFQTVKQYGWAKENGKWYYYRKGKIAKGWVAYKGKWYYTDRVTGERLYGWQKIGGVWHYFRKAGGYLIRNGLWRLDGKLYYFVQDSKRIKDGVPYNGWMNVKGRDYYFGSDGAALSGFQTIDQYTYYFRAKYCYKATDWLWIKGKRYHFNTDELKGPIGIMDTGLVTISGRQYFFDEKGCQVTSDFEMEGKRYSFDENGCCTVSDASGNSKADQTEGGQGITDDLLFFTIWESGRNADFYEGYNQVGGDNGRAFGKYQFDYLYALLPFIKYCYNSDPAFFKAFKPYARLSLQNVGYLKGNIEFYKAWHSVFNSSKIIFAKYQDTYAKKEYYDLTARYLSRLGIDMNKYSDVVKGAVFSYSIQHGQTSAADAVIAARITNTTSDLDFVKRLYAYRMKKFPAYAQRYREEYREAVRRLHAHW